MIEKNTLITKLIEFSREARRNSKNPNLEPLQRLIPNTAVALLRGMGGETRIVDQGQDVSGKRMLALQGEYTEGDLFWNQRIGSPEILFRVEGNQIQSIRLTSVTDASSRYDWGLLPNAGVLALEIGRDGGVKIDSNKYRPPSLTDGEVVEQVTSDFQGVADKVYFHRPPSPERSRRRMEMLRQLFFGR